MEPLPNFDYKKDASGAHYIEVLKGEGVHRHMAYWFFYGMMLAGRQGVLEPSDDHGAWVLQLTQRLQSTLGARAGEIATEISWLFEVDIKTAVPETDEMLRVRTISEAAALRKLAHSMGKVRALFEECDPELKAQLGPLEGLMGYIEDRVRAVGAAKMPRPQRPSDLRRAVALNWIAVSFDRHNLQLSSTATGRFGKTAEIVLEMLGLPVPSDLRPYLKRARDVVKQHPLRLRTEER